MKWIPIILLCLGLAGNCLAADSATNQPVAAQAQIARVKADEFAKRMAEKDVVILDVRTPEEFKDGHIKGATNIDFLDKQFQTNLSKLDKSKTYLVYCRSGGRSAQACRVMERLGFTNMVDLAPGFSGWQRAGQPVEK